MTIQIKELNRHLDDMDVFLDDIVRIWVANGASDEIRDILKQKFPLLIDHKIKGVMLYDDQGPKAFGWVERTSPNYGNMILHTLYDQHKPVLVDTLVNSGLMDGGLFELIQFHDTNLAYRNAFVRHGLLENERQRMALFLDEPFPDIKERDDVELLPMRKKDALDFSTISFHAHDESKDYQGYKDMESIDGRLELEKLVYAGTFGKVINDANLFLCENGVRIGACSVVEIKCWGYDAVPWIFDLVLEPSHHNKGLGTYFFKKVLDILYKNGYPLVGLAVTLNNLAAKHIYESLGFQKVEVFYEYAKV